MMSKQTSRKSLDYTWIENLWEWADENDIPSEDFPRDKENLLSLSALYLDDSHGIMREIPKEIGMLTNLSSLSLDVFDYDSETVPVELGKLTSLTFLHLGIYGDDDREIRIPESYRDLIQLEELSLCGNMTQDSITFMVENTKNLRKLYIEHNEVLQALPNNICSLPFLKELILISNGDLMLTQEQFEWAINLRDDEKGYDRIYSTELPDGSSISYTTDYGQKFKYYSIVCPK